MPELTIIQVSQEELKSMFREVMGEMVREIMEKERGKEDVRGMELLESKEICRILKISPRQFYRLVDQLTDAGMFKIESKKSKYTMLRCDFEKWLKSKHHTDL